ncbi:Potassium channel protein [Mycobacterium marinum MB2]|nr:Potassium channel protein [Mycobacterium marinum MB2]
MASPASGVSRSSIIWTTLGVVVASPSSRPAVSEETTTESAPDCSSRCWFSASRMDATICDLGEISRAVNVTSAAVSSRLAATMIEAACCAPANRSTSDLVASPCTVTNPAAAARSRAPRSVSTTTISPGTASSPSIALIAVLPLVP